MNWHGFGMYGMFGPITDPGEETFSKRVAELGVNIHGSPYRDYDAGIIAGVIEKLPEEDRVFVWGTSLGSNNAPLTCSYTKHRIDGCFGFQASIYGYHSALTANVKFAHLIYSYNPIPFPGLGAYVWQTGSISPASYHRSLINDPHPGDSNPQSQQMFLDEMKRIMSHGNAS